MGETVVATDHLDGVLAVSRSEITVQAGVPMNVLQHELAPYGAFYPPVPTYDGAVGLSPSTRQARRRSITATLWSGSAVSPWSSPTGRFLISTVVRSPRIPTGILSWIMEITQHESRCLIITCRM